VLERYDKFCISFAGHEPAFSMIVALPFRLPEPEIRAVLIANNITMQFGAKPLRERFRQVR
jgi:hypothetical protein